MAMFPFIQNIQNRQIHRARKQISATRRWVREEWGVTANEYGINENALELEHLVVMVA